ncbi:alkene reductase [Stakelama pacifica]|uniref:2,4-dienoyl-CoA reductase-like NADH-dependent reductase (Old Yellow Enzyme family) n=1 Tax=Stakelama pacifica TaxID=517720 RepID=A0A4R6FMW1_9SPHN|nr:alkene reductase [Stakelama pacifica]TDN82926.1 2,4-dienoyl-CoA reductase-like NADH-dependent reductase (Old Yellow Enzyme family) [Stakelama pacifica]GGO95179.1 alkene reductase [Stakelama pacifica]
MPSLFESIALGDIHAPNRVLMAPLTRARGTRDHVPTPIMAEYYAQRASAGLIISEATGISREGLGWPYAPGLWTDEQVDAWKPITDAVHRAGGRIIVQLWHMGRLVHPDFLGGAAPLAPSIGTAPHYAHTYSGKQDYGEARAATKDDIARVLDDYSAAARNAKAAGFDGVQLHAANGYLIDEFLRDGVNKREDEYGGSPENRARLLLEATDRLIGEWGAGRVSVRLSPNGETQGTIDSNPESVFVPAAKQLSDRGIAFLELREPGPDGTFGSTDQPRVSPAIRPVFEGPLVLNQDYDASRAQEALDSGLADAIAFGRPFLANPDLPERLRIGAVLNKDDMATWYTQGPEGYTDYPALKHEAAE